MSTIHEQSHLRTAFGRSRILLLFCILFLVVQHGFPARAADARRQGGAAQSLQTLDLHSAPININNVSLWVSDSGYLERQAPTQLGGLFYPRNTVRTAFAGGLVWAGNVRDGGIPLLRTGGQIYKTGTVPGRILSAGVRESSNVDAVRLYRIRKDWKTADLTRDAAELLNIQPVEVTPGDLADLRARYAMDWLSWPADRGAPYYERNGVPGFQPDTSAAGGDEPGLADADQVIWFVCNDLDTSRSRNFGMTVPAGLEYQITLWAYANRPGLENVVYQRYRLIYKGTRSANVNSILESMYLGKWVDPDIGDFSDDYAGSDPARMMVYAYNSTDFDAEFLKLKMMPPAIGYTLLQGPVIPSAGSAAFWDLRKRQGYMNLPATAGIILANSYLEDDSAFAGNIPAREWLNMLQGYRPRPSSGTPACFTNPLSGACTKFVLDGDPVGRQGWIDGWHDPAGDRRFLISAGPFRMALGDTQEVVFAMVGGQGADHFDAITSLRSNCDNARDFHFRNYVGLAPIPSPPLKIVELDKTFILDWESDTAQTRRVEQFSSAGYSFYSYKIYQFEDSSEASRSVLFPAFDIFNPRSLYVTEDLIRERPLVNGRRYYYAVSAVMYNPDPATARHYIESPLKILPAVPHMPDPGIVFPYTIGDTVQTAVNVKGVNDAPVRLTFFDPTKSTSTSYKVAFTRPSLLNRAKWDLIDLDTRDTLIRGAVIESPPIRVVSRGLTAYVGFPHFGIKGAYQTMYRGQASQDAIFNHPNPAGDYMLVGPGTSQLDTISGYTPSDRDIEWRFTGDSSWALFIDPGSALRSKWIRVPYTVWQMYDDGSGAGRQIYTYVTSVTAADTVWLPKVLLNRSYEGKTLKVFPPVTMYADSQRYLDGKYYGNIYYDDIPFRKDGPTVRALLWASSTRYKTEAKSTIHRVYMVDLDEDKKPAQEGTVIRFVKYKDVRHGDEKIVYPEGVRHNDLQAARQSVGQVNVFPNPYYGMNADERSRFDRFVTFSHLPATATIRIFNTAGILVRTIRKTGASQFEQWDLNNENGLPVASGIYLAHLELQDNLGNDLGTKVLKLMIVQEDHFYKTR